MWSPYQYITVISSSTTPAVRRLPSILGVLHGDDVPEV
jgi:hypothetical protein